MNVKIGTVIVLSLAEKLHVMKNLDMNDVFIFLKNIEIVEFGFSKKKTSNKKFRVN